MRAVIRARTRSRSGLVALAMVRSRRRLEQGAEYGSDVAVRQRAGNVEGVVAADQRFVFQQAAQGLDFLGGPRGEVGEGAFADAFTFASLRARARRGAIFGLARFRCTWALV